MKEHPYPPTTPLNPSEFVFLFPSCLHVAIVEVSLLFLKDTPLTCELNPPASSFVLLCFFQFSHLCCIPSFFLSPQHFQQNSHRFHRFQSAELFLSPRLPSADGLLPCCPSQQPFPRTCLFFLTSVVCSAFCRGLTFSPAHCF